MVYCSTINDEIYLAAKNFEDKIFKGKKSLKPLKIEIFQLYMVDGVVICIKIRLVGNNLCQLQVVTTCACIHTCATC